MTYSIFDFLGNIGVFLILAMYFALQVNKIDARSRLYSILNGVGAALILVSLTANFNLSAAIIETAWLAISAYGLIVNWNVNSGESNGA